MRDNAVLAERLRELASLMEIGGESRFRISAHLRVAQVLESLTEDIHVLAAEPGAIEAVEGIGPSSATRIHEWCRTGSFADLDAWRNRVPPSLLEVLALSGTGPVMTRRLWKEANVTDCLSLRDALRDGRLASIKGLGPRTIAQLDESLKLAEAAQGRFRIGRVLPGARELAEQIAKVPGVVRVAITGSLARWRETAGNVDLIAATTDREELVRAFREIIDRAHGGDRGDSGRDAVAITQSPLPGSQHVVRLCAIATGAAEMHLFITDPAAFGAASIWTTGPETFVRMLCDRAAASGQTLSPDGLSPASTAPASAARTARASDAPASLITEEEIFDRIGLPHVAPERREAEDPLSIHGAVLIRAADITADLHTHSTASDGHLSIEQSVEEAKRRGLRILAITDHSRSSVQANGLSVERLHDHVERIRTLAARTKDLVLLAGSEVDILPDGSLDYDDATLALLDVVVASPHASLRQEPQIATERILRAIRHPAVHIIGHPTGRIIQRRPGLPLDMARICAEAAAQGVALEINANPLRLDLRDVHAAQVMAHGGLIAVNTDMHTPLQFDHIAYGAATARRGGVLRDRCINTWPAEQLLKWLRRRR